MNGSDNAGEYVFAALWVGSPQSIREHSDLYHDLIQTTGTDRDAPGPVVVFEDEVMPIEELVEAFSTDPGFVDAALGSARQRGITSASMGVVFFSSTGKPWWFGSPPNGLAFLGMFPFPAEDSEY